MKQRPAAFVASIGLLAAAVFAAFPLVDLYLSQSRLNQQSAAVAQADPSTAAAVADPQSTPPKLCEVSISVTPEDVNGLIRFMDGQNVKPAADVDLDTVEKQAETTTPLDAANMLKLGTELVNQRQPWQASQYLRRAAVVPDFKGESLFNLARAEAQMGHVKKAIEFLQAAQEAGFHNMLLALADRDLTKLVQRPEFQDVLESVLAPLVDDAPADDISNADCNGQPEQDAHSLEMF